MSSNSPMTRAQKQILVFSLLIIFLIGALVYIFRDQGTPAAPAADATPTLAPEATYVTVDEARDTLPTPTPVPTPTPTFAPTPTISPTSAPEITLMPQSYPTLRRNDAGADVKQMQTRLIELGYLQPGGNDGDFGTGTFNAVREFQRNNNLTTDGVAGPATLSVLYGASPVPANPGGED
ncbi:MAG: peptidoglycan-binding domain-containing protein [Eubacteriales bacterium]|nr:peptidoglycan-binding domain-containing protein [Eubacteriales bacterium]MDD3110021.1 peptidoglycan-binding domain-containing protein [Eubacteriales bacterium]